MKLQNSFFYIQEKSSQPEETLYLLRLNASHPIYSDHFPGNPVTPGVCMLQILKELAIAETGRDLFIHKVAKVRYHQVINPLETPEVSLSLQLHSQEGNESKLTALFHLGEKKFAQFSLLLTFS